MSKANFIVSDDGAVWVEADAPGVGEIRCKFKWLTPDERKTLRKELTTEKKREVRIEALHRAVQIDDDVDRIMENEAEHARLVDASLKFNEDFADQLEKRLVDIDNVQFDGKDIAFESELYQKLRTASPAFNAGLNDGFVKLISGETGRIKNSKAPAGTGRKHKQGRV